MKLNRVNIYRKDNDLYINTPQKPITIAYNVSDDFINLFLNAPKLLEAARYVVARIEVERKRQGHNEFPLSTYQRELENIIESIMEKNK